VAQRPADADGWAPGGRRGRDATLAKPDNQANAGSGRRRRSRSFLILRMAASSGGAAEGRCVAPSYTHSHRPAKVFAYYLGVWSAETREEW